MSDLEFYAEVLCAGTVLGLDAQSTPEHVTAVLGAELGEYRTRDVMVRDFGLVEFSWERAFAERSWRGLGFAVHVYRLGTAPAGLANPALRAAYGDFPAAPPRLGDVRALADGQGWQLDELPCRETEFRQVRQPDSGAVALLGPRQDARSYDSDELPLYRINAPRTPCLPIMRSAESPDRRPALDRLDHLLRLSPEARSTWLASRGPGSDEGGANWWLHHLQVIDFRISQRGGQQGDWIELKLWLLDQGERQGVFTTAATVQSRAWFVAALHDRYAPLPAQITVPDADTLVRDCLAAIPGTPADLARRSDLHTSPRPDLLRSRQARNLIRAAEHHRTRVQDPHLAARLDEWADLRPQLV
jgi:hypothetical protein